MRTVCVLLLAVVVLSAGCARVASKVVQRAVSSSGRTATKAIGQGTTRAVGQGTTRAVGQGTTRAAGQGGRSGLRKFGKQAGEEAAQRGLQIGIDAFKPDDSKRKK
jgi:hypothetical protein